MQIFKKLFVKKKNSWCALIMNAKGICAAAYADMTEQESEGTRAQTNKEQ